MKKVTAIVIGAGDRGNAYASYAINNPGTLEIVAVVNRSEEKRKNFQKIHNIPDDMAFESWNEVFAKEKFADAVLITTNESYHYEPTLLAMEKGYHILLEKPITPEVNTSVEIGDLAEKYDKTFMLCYVLRYTPFFLELKRIVEQGKIGEIKHIIHSENVGIAHYSHSFVRGMFSREENAGPMLLSKSSHDMDILNWIIGSKCKKITSFGTNTYFKPENGPEGAPDRCTDGCPISDTCYFYAPRMYSSERSGFNTSMISVDQSPKGKMDALMEGPFGKCVYKSNNDVVDGQIINMLYENGVTVAFCMTAYTMDCYRSIRIMGTSGEINGNFEKNEIIMTDFSTGNKETLNVNTVSDRHGGGDYYIMTDFLKMILGHEGDNRTAVDGAVDSHVMCFAAEKARHEGVIVDLDEYKEEIRKLVKKV